MDVDDNTQSNYSGLIWGVGLAFSMLFFIFVVFCVLVWRAIGSLGNSVVSIFKRSINYVFRRR